MLMDQKDFQHLSMLPWTGSGDSQTRKSVADLSSHPGKQALDLAEQAQVAAYSYFGFNPQEMRCNFQYMQKGLASSLLQPVELHLHHHHHHYLDAPYGICPATLLGRARTTPGHHRALPTEWERVDDALVQKAVQNILWQKAQERYHNGSATLDSMPSAPYWHLNIAQVESDHPGKEFDFNSQGDHRNFTGLQKRMIDFHILQESLSESGVEGEHQQERYGLLSSLKLKDHEKSWDSSRRSSSQFTSNLIKETSYCNGISFGSLSMSSEDSDPYKESFLNVRRRFGPSTHKRKKVLHRNSDNTKIFLQPSLSLAENDYIFDHKRHDFKRISALKKPLNVGPDSQLGSLMCKLQLHQSGFPLEEGITGHNCERGSGRLSCVKGSGLEEGISTISLDYGFVPTLEYSEERQSSEACKKDFNFCSERNMAEGIELPNSKKEKTGCRPLCVDKVDVEFKGDQTSKQKETMFFVRDNCKVEMGSPCNSHNKRIFNRIVIGNDFSNKNDTECVLHENLSIDGLAHTSTKEGTHNPDLNACTKSQEEIEFLHLSSVLLDNNQKERLSCNEELKEENLERSRLQKLLEMEKFKHETYRKELKEVKRKFEELATASLVPDDEFWQADSGQDHRDLKLVTKDGQSDEVDTVNDLAKIMDYVAEEKILMLLHKRVQVLDKFAEVLEQGNTDVLLELIQVEKISQGRVLKRFEQLKQSGKLSIEEIKAAQRSHCGVERKPEAQSPFLQEGSLEGFETSHEPRSAIQVIDCNCVTEISKCSAGEIDEKVKCTQTRSRTDLKNACELPLNVCETQECAFHMELGVTSQTCQENEYQLQAGPSHSHVLLDKDGVLRQDARADLVAMMCNDVQVLSVDCSTGTESVQDKGLAASKNNIAVQNEELSMLSNVVQQPLSKNSVPSKEDVEVILRHEESHKKTRTNVAGEVETNYDGPKNEQNTKHTFVGDTENKRINPASIIDNGPKASSWSSECPGGYSTVYMSLIFEDVQLSMGCLKLEQKAGDSGSMQSHQMASNRDDTYSNKEKALEEMPVEVFHLKENSWSQLKKLVGGRFSKDSVQSDGSISKKFIQHVSAGGSIAEKRY